MINGQFIHVDGGRPLPIDGAPADGIPKILVGTPCLLHLSPPPHSSWDMLFLEVKSSLVPHRQEAIIIRRNGATKTLEIFGRNSPMVEQVTLVDVKTGEEQIFQIQFVNELPKPEPKFPERTLSMWFCHKDQIYYMDDSHGSGRWCPSCSVNSDSDRLDVDIIPVKPGRIITNPGRAVRAILRVIEHFETDDNPEYLYDRLVEVQKILGGDK